MGSVSIDLSLKYIWQCWFRAFKGKRPSAAVHRFQYHLEHELYQLYSELNNKTYQHGGYQQFIVADNKRRQISMASVRDRIVHRLLYEYLVDLYDTHFSYDVWSCRKGKGVVAALNRASFLLQSHPHSFIWRADVVKFFDTVDHAVLKQILARRVTDPTATWLIHAVIDSFAVHTPTQHSTQPNRTIGIPIGNLTSQIFSNIYLNELDRFVQQTIKPQRYMRYGDDFIVIAHQRAQVEQQREHITSFVHKDLRLSINPKNDIIVPARHGIRFLGVTITPHEKRLNKRNRQRAHQRLKRNNIPSYSSMMKQHGTTEDVNALHWKILDLL